jgi:hypothetical protein
MSARRATPDAPGAELEPARGTRDTPGTPDPTDDDLRALLPALEPERTLDDWGRSERIEGLFDRTISEFLYHLWFRCDVEGIEHVPPQGGALVVSNHAGALPPDAAMIAKAEIIALLPSLDAAGLRALHAHESATRGRREVIGAIERLQRWEPQS